MFGAFTTIVVMTLLLPFLPLYVEQLGVKNHAAIVHWSGVAYGATFLSAALVAPLWGRLADCYGRKLMLIRASLGMAIAMALIGMAQDVWQLVGLRLLAGLLRMFANMSIKPIITVHVSQLIADPAHVTLMAGVVISATALGSMLSASHLGKLADRNGAWNVIVGGLAVSAVLLVPQAFVTAGWQLVALGYSISAQYTGQVVGPLFGGFVGGHFGMRAVFLGTCVLVAGGAWWSWRAQRHAVVAPG